MIIVFRCCCGCYVFFFLFYLFIYFLFGFTHTREISSSCFVCTKCVFTCFNCFSSFLIFLISIHDIATQQNSCANETREKNMIIILFIINEHRAFIQNAMYILCVCVVVVRMCPNERFLSKKFHNRIGARFFSTTHNIMLSHFIFSSAFWLLRLRVFSIQIIFTEYFCC